MRRFLVLALLCLVTPGLAEAAENLWHLATTGHGAHQVTGSALRAGSTAQPAQRQAPFDDEHGCTSTFHLCSCCHSARAHTATAALSIPHLGLARRLAAEADSGVAPPALAALDRPPEA